VAFVQSALSVLMLLSAKQYFTGWPQTWKTGILRDFSEHGKLGEFCATSAKNCNKQCIFSSSFKFCVKQLVTCYIAGVVE